MVRIAEVEPSGQTVLGCQGCGEGMVLFGLEEDWRSEGRTVFGCAGCGEELTLDDDRLGEEEEPAVRKVEGLPGGVGGGP
ncbi:MAG: hypothetical protein M3Q60_14060 [Actinomycetota bacterium]|nr:hypothetical protein [Actinomycetota bacterium]